MFNVPVLLIIYNRPQLTSRVFAEIRNIKPERLYIAADGARGDRPGDPQQVAAAREIASAVDWPCQVKKLFREKNLGCKVGPSSAINWFFENEAEGIILEDDCLPHPSFFPFCQELLAQYRNDERVMMISGDNFLNNPQPYSYYFSRYPHIWGWASWRRAWKFYDVNIPLWPQVRDSGILNTFLSPAEAKHWRGIFETTFRDKNSTSWDHQWTLACWINNGLTILPEKNLVKNIGLGLESTHTKESPPSHCPPLYAMEFPLRHPPFIVRNLQADQYTYTIFLQKPFWGTRFCKLFFSVFKIGKGRR